MLAFNRILYENDHCCIEHFYAHEKPSNTVACVFSSGGNRRLEGNHFGGNFLIKNGFDVIAFKITNDDWFQSIPSHVFDLIDRLIKANGYVRRVGMGASMGAYGAIAFSKLLHLDTVLAYSPQFRIDQDFDRRWQDYALKIQWQYPITKATISKSCDFFIFYDDKNLDGEQFRLLQSVIEPQRLYSKSISHSGHCSSIYFHETGYLKEVTQQILESGRLKTMNVKLNRHHSHAYMLNLYQELMKRNKQPRALWVLDTALITQPRNPVFLELRNKYPQSKQHLNVPKSIKPLALSPIALAEGLQYQNSNRNYLRPIRLIIPFYKNPQLVYPIYESLIRSKADLRALKCTIYFYIDSPGDEKLKEAIHTCINQNILDIRVIENKKNLGFIQTVNQGLEAAIAAQNDVIILNSDTQIFPRALAEVVRVAYLDPMIGFVSPRSNDATLCTLPHDAKDLSATPITHYERYQVLAKYLADYSYVPTGVGFCLFIKWTVLAEFGGFDHLYGQGYNEENDLIMRANRSGFRVALANKAFVFHIGEATMRHHSVGRDKLEEGNKKLLLDRYPYYDRLIHNYHESPEYRAEQLLTPLLDREEPHICFDLSAFGTYHNGTFEAGLATLKAASLVWPKNIQIIVCISKEAWAFHGLGIDARLRRIDVHQPNEKFSAVIKYGQPVSANCISRVLSRAPVVTFFMLDTIAADCGDLSVDLDENLWRFVMKWSDIVFTNSQFSAQQLTRRYGLGQRTNLKPIVHSMDPMDYGQPNKAISLGSPVFDTLNLEDYLLVVGNKFPHKFVEETLKMVTKELPHLQFIVLGTAAQKYKNVLYLEAGNLTPQEMDTLYGSVKAIIFPSHYEGFGFPIMHALARHKPIYLRRLPPFEEIAKNIYIIIISCYRDNTNDVPYQFIGGDSWIRMNASNMKVIQDKLYLKEHINNIKKKLFNKYQTDIAHTTVIVSNIMVAKQKKEEQINNMKNYYLLKYNRNAFAFLFGVFITLILISIVRNYFPNLLNTYIFFALYS